MTFNELPNETLQLIVDRCAEADRAYRAGKEGNEIRGGNSKKQQLANDWKGRSCRAISLVNRALRSMAMKHIFKTIFVDRITDDAFQFGIYLNPSALSLFSEIDFEDWKTGRGRISNVALFQTVLHVMPLLTNLRAIRGLQSHHILTLFGPSGFDKPHLGDQRSSKQTSAASVFLETATRITDWDLQIDEGNLEKLVNRNAAGIKRLSLSSSMGSLITIFEKSDSRVPQLLVRLSNLEHLRIVQATWSDDDQDINQIVDSVFESPFSTLRSLRSLDLHFHGNCAQEVTRELKFAALFPSLRRLVISINSREPYDTHANETFTFLHLEHLELKGIDADGIGSFFSCLELPSIVEIHFNSIVDRAFESLDLEEELVDHLEKFNHTLRKIKISKTADLCPVLPQTLAQSQPASLELDFFTLLGVDVALPDDDDFGFEFRESSATPGLLADPFYEKSEELLNWAKEEAFRLKGRDLQRGKYLVQALKSVEDLKKWSEA